MIQKPDNKPKAIIWTIPKAENNSENNYNYNYNCYQQASDEKHDNTSSIISEVWIRSVV